MGCGSSMGWDGFQQGPLTNGTQGCYPGEWDARLDSGAGSGCSLSTTQDLVAQRGHWPRSRLSFGGISVLSGRV